MSESDVLVQPVALVNFVCSPFHADGSIRLQRPYIPRSLPQIPLREVKFDFEGRLGIPLRMALNEDYTKLNNGLEIFDSESPAIYTHLEVNDFWHRSSIS